MAKAAQTQTTRTIYVIEDDFPTASAIREVLEIEGKKTWEVTIITNGNRAVEAIDCKTPDLVLLDLRLPGANGGEIYQHLCNTQQESPPIVFITGASHYDLHLSGIDDGIILHKPVHMGTLLCIIHAHLDAA